MNPRSEPLLWVQLISLGALPLEVLLLLLLLAGADPGPLPLLERLLAWALGALAPALLLWRRPADVRSLLLVTTGLPPDERLRRLARLQTEAVPRLLFAAGVLVLLPLTSWLDTTAALASPFSPVQDTGRLTCLLLSAALLAVMIWQWQQLIQAIWLLIRTPDQLELVAPLSDAELLNGRRNLGLPLLVLRPLELPPLVRPTPPAPASTIPVPDPKPEASAEPETVPLAEAETPGQSISEDSEAPASGLPVAVEPEQPCEQHESTDLDQQIG